MNTHTIQLSPFAHEVFGELRITDLEGLPWFVAADVCQALEIANSRDATSRLRDTEKATVGLTDSGNRPYKITLVNEPGLYRLIFTSRKKEAELFQDWVFTEVLPALRKTGVYSMASEPLAQIAFDPLADIDHRIATFQITNKRSVGAYLALIEGRRKLLNAVEADSAEHREILELVTHLADDAPFPLNFDQLLEVIRALDLFADTLAGASQMSVCASLGKHLARFQGRAFTLADGRHVCFRIKGKGRGRRYFVRPIAMAVA